MTPKELPAITDLGLTESQVAWLAGLFEGEASFSLDKRSKKRYKTSTSPASASISIQLTDADVLERAARFLNKKYTCLKRRTSKNKTVYKLYIGDRATLRYLLPRLYPFLGERRQKQVQLCLNALAEWEMWYLSGGRSAMAKIGPSSKKKV